MLVGVLGTYWMPARRWMHTRLRVPFLRTIKLRNSGDVSVGEILLGAAFVRGGGLTCSLAGGCCRPRAPLARLTQWGLFVYWILYWTGTASFAAPLYVRVVQEVQVGVRGCGWGNMCICRLLVLLALPV